MSSKREKYKPTAKTIVTEIRHFIVDAVRRVSSGRQSVAAEVLDATLHQLDVVVSKDNPYVMKDVRHALSISTPSPVMLELTAFGEIPEAEIRNDKVFFSADINIDPIIAGKFINVEVQDGDMVGATVMVEAFNVRSGETEYMTLHCYEKGRYKGFIQSLNTADAGVNFDGVMYCKDGDSIRFTYLEAFNEQGMSENISKEAQVTSLIKETKILFNEEVLIGQELQIAVYNGGYTNPVASVVNTRTLTTVGVELAEQDDGTLVGSLRTGPEDLEGIIGVADGDTLHIVHTDAFDTTGLRKTLEGDCRIIVPSTSRGQINIPAMVKVYGNLDIEVRDYDLNSNEVVVSVNNFRTGLSTHVELLEVWPNMRIFRGSLAIPSEIALPGDILELTYSDYGSPAGTDIITKQITVVSHVDHAAPADEEPTSPFDSRLSKPVRMTINGSFFLNGSFAGTLKLYTEDKEAVRCTILKA